jgi:hypothetical protein
VNVTFVARARSDSRHINMKAFQKLDSEKAGPLSLSNIYVESVPDKLPEKEILEFPEGGLQGWLTVLGSCVKIYLYLYKDG